MKIFVDDTSLNTNKGEGTQNKNCQNYASRGRPKNKIYPSASLTSNPRKPSSLIVVFEWCKKLDITRREFCRQCIRIWNMKVCVPAGNAFFDISCVVRHGIDTNVLQNDHRRTSLDNAEEDVVVTGSLKRDVEPETVAIKRQCCGDIFYDEEWRNAGNFCF